MAGNQWEVVGGKAKKNKNKAASKQQLRDKNGESFPIELLSGHLTETETIYAAFLEKEQRKEERNKAKANDSMSKGNAQQKKKKGDKKLPTSKHTLEDAAAALTEDDLKKHLTKLDSLWPNSPSLWLKDLAPFLNEKLDIASEDATFSNKPKGYPLSLINKKINQRIVKLVHKCTPQMLQNYHEFCLQNMVQDILKGLHTIGYRIMLQLLALEMPQIVLLNIPKCIELCNAHQNRQNVCLTVLWAAGQVGTNNLEAGCRVWMDLMFPLIGSKNCTLYAVEYLEKLVNAPHCNQSVLSAHDLFPILDYVYSKDLVKSVQKRLLSFYPALKSLSYGSELETVLRNYFPSYLHRLKPNCPKPLKEELLSSLTYCLEKDVTCFRLWKKLHFGHQEQSKLLLDHLNSLPEKNFGRLNRQFLRDTISDFQKKDQGCVIPSELLSKTNSSSFPFLFWVLVGTFITLSAACFYILAQDSFLVSNQWVHKFKVNLQHYSGEFRKRCIPLIDTSMSKLSATMVSLWKETKEFRVWFSLNTPPVLIKTEELVFDYGTWLWAESKLVAALISKSIVVGMVYVVETVEVVTVWIENSPQIMSALEATKQFAGNLQQNAAHLMNLAKQYIPA